MKILICILSLFFTQTLSAEIIAREGQGFLEKVDGQLILHVKGSSYEMGVQHGKLLGPIIQKNISTYLNKPRPEFNQRGEEFRAALPQILKHIPSRLMQEMQGLAEGSGISFE